jgi:hypothetical protein
MMIWLVRHSVIISSCKVIVWCRFHNRVPDHATVDNMHRRAHAALTAWASEGSAYLAQREEIDDIPKANTQVRRRVLLLLLLLLLDSFI